MIARLSDIKNIDKVAVTAAPHSAAIIRGAHFIYCSFFSSSCEPLVVKGAKNYKLRLFGVSIIKFRRMCDIWGKWIDGSSFL